MSEISHEENKVKVIDKNKEKLLTKTSRNS